MLLIGARKRTVKHYLLEFRKEILLSVAQTLKDTWLVFLLKNMVRFKNQLFDKLFDVFFA